MSKYDPDRKFGETADTETLKKAAEFAKKHLDEKAKEKKVEE